MPQVLDTPKITQDHRRSLATEAFDAPARPAVAPLQQARTPGFLLRAAALVHRVLRPRHNTSRRCGEQQAETAIDRLIRTDPYLYITAMSG
jgi:hypothetical protein